MRQITLCIINYNGAQHLPHAFAALRAADDMFAEIMVVDNASTDDSATLAVELCPQATLLRRARNDGPGAARNAGMAAARHDLVLFIDNDVRLEPGAAALLLDELLAHPGTLAVAPRVLYAADRTRVQFDSADCHFLGLMATRNADVLDSAAGTDACVTTSLVTACFLIDRSLWNGDPPFDETLGFNLEDHDFGVRACVAGHRLRVQPRARALHGSGTAGLSYRPGQIPATDRQFFLTRNRWVVIAKCFSTRTLFVLAPAFVLFEVVQFGWLAAQRRAGVWLRAVRSLWRMRGRLAAERRTVQRSRRAPDRLILRDAPLPVTQHARRSRGAARLICSFDALLRTYWRLTCRWVG